MRSLKSSALSHIGELIAVRCAVPRGKPAVDLSWRFDRMDGLEDIHLPELHDEGRTVRALSHTLQARLEMHNRYLVCLVSSELVFPSQSIECRIGPFRIFHPPMVTVLPHWVSLAPVGIS